jgi:hypothetical protein
MATILADFFRYYALEFPYATEYISVSEGRLVPKEGTDWITDLRGEGQEQLVVQDIISLGGSQCQAFILTQRLTYTSFRPDVDIAKGLGRLPVVREAMKEASVQLLKHMGPMSQEMKAGDSCLSALVCVHENVRSFSL